MSAVNPPIPELEKAEHWTKALDVIELSARVELARKCAAEKDILEWGRTLFEEKFPLPFCRDLHEYLIEIRGEPLTGTEAPRGHAKTVIKCFLVPIFQALEEPDTFWHYLNVQATEKKALDINRAIKLEFEDNEVLRALYGDMRGRRWTDEQFVLKNDVIFTAISASQSIRGIAYRNKRPDYILVDDLYNEDDINNAESTEKKNDWLWSTLYPARAKSRRNAFHVQGTAINVYDVLEKMKGMAAVKFRTFKAILDEEAKTVLWPELNTYESLMTDQELMGSLIFNREMQNERWDGKTAIIQREWLANWEFDPRELMAELAVGSTRILAGVIIGNDPSIGKKVESDETGTSLVLKTAWIDARDGNEYWIMHVDGKRRTLMERIEHLVGLNKRQPENQKVTSVEIEAIAGFDDYASEVIRKTNLPVHRVEWVNDKITVLMNKSHYFENGKVRCNKNIEPKEKDKLIHQLTNNHPKHDDVRDSVLLTLDDQTGLWGFVS